MSKNIAKRIFWILTGITAVLLVAHLVMQTLNLQVFHEKQGQVYELSNRFDVDDEGSIPTWFAQALLLAVGAAAFCAARLEARRSVEWAWRLIGAGGVLFSLDEVAGLHEFVLQSIHLLAFGARPETLADNAWWFVLPIVAMIGGVFLGWLYRLLPKRIFMLFLVAGIVYIIGSIGFEILGDVYDKGGFMYQGAMTGVEETLEMVGSIIALYAVLNYLEIRHGQKIKAAAERLLTADI